MAFNIREGDHLASGMILIKVTLYLFGHHVIGEFSGIRVRAIVKHIRSPT